ncbi:unnamed protein product [Cyberlindnera jadinii]|uniref:Uncharacterized protein n=1 Tax=Cyberlindnera jadinii (strain ATCC 18201 / CBS 1600 / BCRC 20928 / JCM 3617 / NBRC 0987 / NRRL Y-1542) TaxID=983966 RepID=A0A0H5C412_CYBJN|nr:unnamed protein product [Cyberlindnera jadinii]
MYDYGCCRDMVPFAVVSLRSEVYGGARLVWCAGGSALVCSLACTLEYAVYACCGGAGGGGGGGGGGGAGFNRGPSAGRGALSQLW